MTLCDNSKARWGQPRTIISQAGRDRAVVNLLQSAKKSVYLRTEGLTLVPVGNELAQAIQRQASITVELPLDVCLSPSDSRLPRIFMELGALVTFKSDPSSNYRGTLLVVDEAKFLYSASALTVSPSGTQVSYVMGQMER